MRAVAFIIAFTLGLCGGSVSGPTDNLPNAGLFMFDSPAQPSMVVASR